MIPENAQDPPKRQTLLLGMSLIAIGLLLLILNRMEIDYARFTWPFFVIAPGVLLFFISFLVDEKVGKVLNVAGSVVSMTGLILFFQNLSGQWQSWAYVWALICPFAVGVGQIALGARHHREKLIASGRSMTVAGLILFGAGFIFFELIIGIGGHGLGGFGWPLILIAIGVLLLVLNFWQTKRKH